MADREKETQPADATALTYDAETHGESAGQRGNRSTPEGEVRTQRGERSDVPPDFLKHGREIKDVSPRAVFFALIGFVAAIALSAALVAGLLFVFRDMDEREPVSPLARRNLVPPQPRLEVSPPADRTRIEAEAMAHLSGYGWIDRDAGRARIPIERAMQLLGEHGWPDPVDVGRSQSSIQANVSRSVATPSPDTPP